MQGDPLVSLMTVPSSRIRTSKRARVDQRVTSSVFMTLKRDCQSHTHFSSRVSFYLLLAGDYGASSMFLHRHRHMDSAAAGDDTHEHAASTENTPLHIHYYQHCYYPSNSTPQGCPSPHMQPRLLLLSSPHPPTPPTSRQSSPLRHHLREQTCLRCLEYCTRHYPHGFSGYSRPNIPHVPFCARGTDGSDSSSPGRRRQLPRRLERSWRQFQRRDHLLPWWRRRSRRSPVY